MRIRSMSLTPLASESWTMHGTVITAASLRMAKQARDLLRVHQFTQLTSSILTPSTDFRTHVCWLLWHYGILRYSLERLEVLIWANLSNLSRNWTYQTRVPNHRTPRLQVLARAIQWLATVQTKASFQSPAKRSSGESQMMIVETAMRPKPSKTCVCLVMTTVESHEKLRWLSTWRCLSLRLKSTTKPCRTLNILIVIICHM